MATKSVITKIRRKKMAEASHTTGTVAKITHIALGSGGVNGDGTVIVPLAENVALKKEVVRKPYTSSKYSLQGTTQGNGLTGGVPPVRFSM